MIIEAMARPARDLTHARKVVDQAAEAAEEATRLVQRARNDLQAARERLAQAQAITEQAILRIRVRREGDSARVRHRPAADR